MGGAMRRTLGYNSSPEARFETSAAHHFGSDHSSMSIQAMTWVLDNSQHEDSQVTIGRLFWGWAMNNLPELWVRRWLQVKGRLGKITPLLLMGHPSASELRTGRAANGSPVSVHQVFVDEECQRLAREYVSNMEVKVTLSKCKTCGAA